ncbi:hypothetical protein FACS1894217_03780 [Clostridia bacterium]|nr:hypothetical protein FACS1894217_03780 [Clostridia bacterium]
MRLIFDDLTGFFYSLRVNTTWGYDAKKRNKYIRAMDYLSSPSKARCINA